MNILKKTLDEMNHYFSSNEFARQAKKNGLTQREVNNGIIASFLHKSAIRCETNRMWRKRTNNLNIENSSNKIEEAIKLLKSNGFKVLRPISDWEEL